MAGFWNLSNSQLHDLNGKPYPGAKAYFYAADSLSKITVYSDYGLGTAHPNPVEADGNGFFPAVFLDEADEFFRQRITTRAGVTVAGADLPVLPIIGPSGGGGGSEVPVDANAIYQTGDVMWQPVSGTRAGWVRDNGRTIGSATSGASERANSDCEQLYLFGWAKGWSVVGGAGASAAADWAANKPITLPDMRLKGPFGLADMGNSALSAPTTLTFTSGDSTTAGSVCGANSDTLTVARMPAHSHGGTTGGQSQSHTHGFTAARSSGFTASADGGAVTDARDQSGTTDNENQDHTHSIPSQGGGEAHNNVQWSVLGTFYRKL